MLTSTGSLHCWQYVIFVPNLFVPVRAFNWNVTLMVPVQFTWGSAGFELWGTSAL